GFQFSQLQIVRERVACLGGGTWRKLEDEFVDKSCFPLRRYLEIASRARALLARRRLESPRLRLWLSLDRDRGWHQSIRQQRADRPKEAPERRAVGFVERKLAAQYHCADHRGNGGAPDRGNNKPAQWRDRHTAVNDRRRRNVGNSRLAIRRR